MSTALAKVQPIQENTLTQEQIDLITRTVARGATPDELALFLYQCKRTGLDPLLKQIHAVKRWDNQAQREVMTIQTGIDGYRLVASRTSKLAGIDDAVFDKEDGDHPGKASVTVYKLDDTGQARPYTASARWSEYVQTKKDGSVTSFWKRMPYGQLGKCAEALALRKAFPNDLSGVYTFEEMEQASSGPGPVVAADGQVTLECEDCHGPISDWKGEVSGKDFKYTLSQIQVISRKLYEKDFCGDCLKKRSELKKGKSAEGKQLEAKTIEPTDDCEILDIEGVFYARGTVSQILKSTKQPLNFRIGRLMFQCWHKNTLVPAIRSAEGKVIEVAFSVKDDYRIVDKIAFLDGKEFASLYIQDAEIANA